MAATSTIYVLHFDPPYRAPIGETGRFKTAGHYIGSTAGDVLERYTQHVTGNGSPLVRAAVAAGSSIRLVATMPGGRTEERLIKATHHRERWCPLCTAQPHDKPPQSRAGRRR